MLYLLLMLPLGIIYFTLAVTGLAVGLRLALAPLVVLGRDLVLPAARLSHRGHLGSTTDTPGRPADLIGSLFVMLAGLLILDAAHARRARYRPRMHARLAKALLVEPGA